MDIRIAKDTSTAMNTPQSIPKYMMRATYTFDGFDIHILLLITYIL